MNAIIESFNGTVNCKYRKAVRFSPNSSPRNEKITDEELLCIYFYCRRFENRHNKSEIYDFATRFMKSWFPQLPTYANFNKRINVLHSSILALTTNLLQSIDCQDIIEGLDREIAPRFAGL